MSLCRQLTCAKSVVNEDPEHDIIHGNTHSGNHVGQLDEDERHSVVSVTWKTHSQPQATGHQAPVSAEASFRKNFTLTEPATQRAEKFTYAPNKPTTTMIIIIKACLTIV